MIFHISTAIIDKMNAIICSNTAKNIWKCISVMSVRINI